MSVRARRNARKITGQNTSAQQGMKMPFIAPDGGMNTRDPVTQLPPNKCRSLKNMLGESGYVQVRKGSQVHQNVAAASVGGSMFTYKAVNNEILLAAMSGEIYDVSGTPSALTSASYNTDDWSIEQLSTYAIGVNGQDTPWTFDGASMGATGFTGSGLTLSNLRTIKLVRNRLWFTEIDQAHVWYGGIEAITGTLTKFQLDQETRGGYCLGVYEYRNFTVFIMSTGEIKVYQGDPATDFTLVDTYTAPRPVGYGCGFDADGDLIIMTSYNPVPFEAIASGIANESVSLAAWGQIQPSWEEDYKTYKALTPWNGFYYNGLLIFNIPTGATTSKQWVFNKANSSWSYFEDMNAGQFAEYEDSLYFTHKNDSDVFMYAGGTDDSSNISAQMRHKFVYPFPDKRNAQFTLGRVNITSEGTATAAYQVDTDFGNNGITSPYLPISTSGSGPWDGPWDGPWGTQGEGIKKWRLMRGFGSSVSPVIDIVSSADSLKIYAMDVIAGQAGVMGV